MTSQDITYFRDQLIGLLDEKFRKEAVFNAYFRINPNGEIISQGTEKTINDFGNNKEEIKAANWFGNYWFYIRISFQFGADINVLLPFVSVSFFQKTNDSLKQLFRAEWDSYSPIEGYNHPQPHWHITSHLSDVNSFEALGNEEEENIFNELAGNTKSINLDKMHFAMGGNWIASGEMIHQYKDEHDIVNWMIQLFNHVKEELSYKD